MAANLAETIRPGFYERFCKRALDLSVSLVLCILISPILIALALIILIFMGRPVLFVQKRVGLNNRVFHIVKFRSMLTDGSDAITNDGDRITALGKFLRASSLDELPELLNVVRGDMSLVGPRPLLVHYLPLYSIQERRRHEVRPGITGLAQISGRNEVPWEKRFALDVWYVDHVTFIGDMKILIQTLLKVLTRRGISAPNFATSPEFLGNDSNSGESAS